MAAAKNGNGRRKAGNKQGNVRKLKQGGQKRINMRAGLGAMFNPNLNQVMNPGYMDFNEPAIRPNIPPINIKPANAGGGGAKTGGNMINHKNRQTPNRRPQQLQRSHGNWAPPIRIPPIPPPMNQRLGPGPSPRMHPMPPPRMHPMGPPMSMRGPPMPPPHPPHPPHLNARFGLRCPPIPPPMGPMGPMGIPRPLPGMGMGPIGPPRPLIARRNGPNTGGPIRRHSTKTNRKSNKSKRKPGNPANNQKKQNVPQNQYPIDKPWVTDEIREQYNKKQELENKLKGNRNDQLFAEFKTERDKYVTMYEAARLEYIGKQPEQNGKPSTSKSPPKPTKLSEDY